MATPGLTLLDAVGIPAQAQNTTVVAAGTSTNTVIKAAPGRIFTILITTTGTNPLTIADAANSASAATGNVIGACPASPAVGTNFSPNNPAIYGITVVGNSANPGFTVSWS